MVLKRFQVSVIVALLTILSMVFMQQLSIHAEESSENLALGKDVDVTSFCNSCGTYGPHAVDGDMDTYWRALSGDARPTITLDLAEVTEWNKVVMNLNPDAIGEYSVEYSVDGEEWTEAYILGYSPADSVEEFVIEPVNAQYVRIGFEQIQTGVALLYELEIYNVDEEPTEPPAAVLSDITLADNDTTYGYWDEIELDIGDERQFAVTGTMSDGSEADLSDATITMESTNPDVIEAGDNGSIQVVGDGVAKLEVTVDLPPVSHVTEVFVISVNMEEDVIWDASWSHPDIVSEIGQPAILSQGEAYPSLKMEAYTNMEIQGELLDEAGNTVEQVSTQLEQGELDELSIPGTATAEGTYKLRLLLSPEGQAPVYDTFYFTVHNGGEPTAAYLGGDGQLHYVPDYKGNHILDFSNSGYKGGGVKLPDVQARIFVEPGEGDDTERIQAAIDQVSQMPVMEDGFRGAVILGNGTFEVGETLRISADGVVLRGQGSGEDGTILFATGTESRDVLEIRGTGAPVTDENSSTEITEMYVPSGARTFHVADASGFEVGDTVMVRRHGNDQWIHAIDMDQIMGGKDIVQWSPFSLDFDRVITGIDGNNITVDAPIANAIERRWGGGEILRYDDEGRIENVGVEKLRVKVDFDTSVTLERDGEEYYADENKARNFVSLNNVKDAWVRNIDAYHLEYALADIGRTAKHVTVQDTRALEPVGEIAGSRRYAYNYSGQLLLTQRTYAEEFRHAFVVNSRVPGPNVFLNSISENEYTNSEPHHRWSVGGLYDNIQGNIAFQDRASYGTGHGWSGANYVAWNTEGRLIAQSPPTAQNYAIGHVGEKAEGNWPNDSDPRPREDAYWESLGEHVAPQSLYLQQLQDRLGAEAVENIEAYPVGGEALDTPEVDHIATLEMIYVDGSPLEAFDPEQFSYEVELPFGTLDAPDVTAEGEYEIQIEQAEDLSDQTVIQVFNDDGIATEYVLSYMQELKYDPLEYYLEVEEVTASADDGNVPENTIDNDQGTRWSAEGNGQWIQYDLGESYPLSAVSLAFYSVRSSIFDIEVSEDNENWTTVFSGQSAGISTDYETFYFDEPVEARYVRYMGYGADTSSWNSITETRIHPILLGEINALDTLTVELGTEASALSLPETVDGLLNDATPINLPVIWDLDNAEYDGNTPGTYTLTGEVDVLSDVNPGELQASIDIIVEEETGAQKGKSNADKKGKSNADKKGKSKANKKGKSNADQKGKKPGEQEGKKQREPEREEPGEPEGKEPGKPKGEEQIIHK